MARISLALGVALGLVMSVVPAGRAPAQEEPGVTINEIRIDQPDADNDEYFELKGPAGNSLDGLTYLVIGDGAGSGTIEAVVDLSGSSIPGTGLFVAAESTFTLGTPDLTADLNFENSDNVTHLLVRDFTGSDGQDLDTDEDGVLDATPWAAELDRLALVEEENPPSGTEYHYGPPSVGPDGSFVPGHAFNCPDDGWHIGDFGGADDTPGAENPCGGGPPPPDDEATTCLFVNEIHYDNSGADVNEAIEVAGTPGTLTGYSLVLYNGSNGSVYRTIGLSGSIADQQNGHGTATFAIVGIQNGSPDGIALVNPAGEILQFLSYEGVFLAGDGPADGRWSRDIGVVEGSSTPADHSLQLTGADNAGFSWVGSSANSFGEPNAGQTFGGACPTPEPPPPPPPAPEVEIHEVQGSEMSSGFGGQRVTIDGIVVGDFQRDTSGDSQLRGFHLQEATGDGDEATSDGIFVFDPDAPDVSLGDYVVVTGTVAEFDGLTEITDVTDISTPDTAPPDEMGPIAPTLVTLPVSSEDEWEQYEGMLITFGEAELYISEFFNFDRTNEIVLTTDRQYQGTQIAEPGDAANAVAAANALARVTIDDGRMTQNPDPALHPNGGEFDLTNTFRGGDILSDVTGVVHESKPYFSDFVGIEYRVHQTAPADYEAENPRPTSPEDVGGDLRVATFNVLNFFTHLDDGVNDICGPTGDMECRGADTQEELDRQLAKLVAGIIALDADVVGIQEVENDIYPEEIDGNRAHDAVRTLVEALNAAEGQGTWAWAGEANHYNDYPVRNDLIYRRQAVVAKGSPMALAHNAFDRTRPEAPDEPVGRPPLAQTFLVPAERGRPEVFTVVVNHFKSKGSSCTNIGDPDVFDGQANCNITRVAQANALLDFVGELQEDSGDPDVLVIGDLNSYAMEDPIQVLEGGGFTDLVRREADTPRVYTYLFDGQLGTLDYIMANETLLDQVEGVTVFHINADEPDILDYDTSFKRPAQDDLYESKPYRVSDHDPVIVGLTLESEGVPGRGTGPPPGRGPR